MESLEFEIVDAVASWSSEHPHSSFSQQIVSDIDNTDYEIQIFIT